MFIYTIKSRNSFATGDNILHALFPKDDLSWKYVEISQTYVITTNGMYRKTNRDGIYANGEVHNKSQSNITNMFLKFFHQ